MNQDINYFNNMMNPNNFASMPINQNNNNNLNNLNNNGMIMNLVNQNIQMTHNIGMNNEMIKNILYNMKNEMEKKLLNIDFFQGDDRVEKINVLFKGDDGSIINIIAPKNVKMKELLKTFFIKLQISDIINEKPTKKPKDFFFFFKGSIISYDDQRSASDFGLTDEVNDILFKAKNALVGG